MSGLFRLGYKKLLFGKLEVNEGMIFENIVAQMLTANGKALYGQTPEEMNNILSQIISDR